LSRTFVVLPTIMASFFARMNPNQRLWATVGGVIVAGTVFKVSSTVFLLTARPYY